MENCWHRGPQPRFAKTIRSSGSTSASGSTQAMLQIESLYAWYGASHVLQNIGLEVNKGEIVCLIGRNGAGKTTTLKSIMGLLDKRRGSVIFKGKVDRSRGSCGPTGRVAPVGTRKHLSVADVVDRCPP